MTISARPRQRMAALEQGIKDMIAAWESLPGNRYYNPRDIEEWLRGPMKENIDKLRKLVG